jgi:hypothetical protein
VIARGLSLLLLAALMMSCTHAGSQPGDPRAQASLIIIKFTDDARTPPRALQVRMEDSRKITLEHERAMSGGAHVYRGVMTGQQLAAVVARLQQRDAVEYAEVDRRMSF